MAVNTVQVEMKVNIDDAERALRRLSEAIARVRNELAVFRDALRRASDALDEVMEEMPG